MLDFQRYFLYHVINEVVQQIIIYSNYNRILIREWIMMKKTYTMPQIYVEEFVANRAIAACDQKKLYLIV